MNRNAPQFDAAQAAQGGLYFGGIASWRKIDDYTVEITTKVLDAVLPYSLASIFMSSPAQYEKIGKDWNKFAEQPSGTGPWKLELFKPRERAELVRNADYWDKARIPKCERLILLPIPDANTRVAALLSGHVDWVEAPPPDAIARLKQQKMQIVTNLYPHVWPYMLSFEEGSPFSDIRVRKAANMAIDREGLVKLLGGLAVPAIGMVNPGHPWFGKPDDGPRVQSRRRQEAPRGSRLQRQEPGQGEVHHLAVGLGADAAPADERVHQGEHADVGIDVEFEVLDWEALRNRRRLGAAAPENRGHARHQQLLGLLGSRHRPDRAGSTFMKASGFNWGNYSNPKAEELAKAAKEAFDPQEQDKLLARAS